MPVAPTIPKDLTFLVLEDMENLRQQMVRDLKSLGFSGTIHEAENVSKAHEILKSQPINYIVSDWNLPDGTGLDLLKKCREIPKFKDLPFLMVTSMDSISDMLDAINAGVSDYLVKPWSKEELNKKINYAYGTAMGWNKK